VYYPGSSPQAKRKQKRTDHLKKHISRVHGHGHTHKKAVANGNGMARTAYYDSKAGKADGLVFMNHKGGQGSGVFDQYVFPVCVCDRRRTSD
jgi:hypothetical protein